MAAHQGDLFLPIASHGRRRLCGSDVSDITVSGAAVQRCSGAAVSGWSAATKHNVCLPPSLPIKTFLVYIQVCNAVGRICSQGLVAACASALWRAIDREMTHAARVTTSSVPVLQLCAATARYVCMYS